TGVAKKRTSRVPPKAPPDDKKRVIVNERHTSNVTITNKPTSGGACSIEMCDECHTFHAAARKGEIANRCEQSKATANQCLT
ncbi:MAG: hypothetical protein K2N72_03875, partial [Oscillospiraceae bacterium]|nr:hypothetical protein [Oscillospiraceae bacterium]